MNWKKALDSIQPYKPGRSIEEAKRIYGLDEVVKLASNENPYGCAPSVKDLFDISMPSSMKCIRTAMQGDYGRNLR